MSILTQNHRKVIPKFKKTLMLLLAIELKNNETKMLYTISYYANKQRKQNSSNFYKLKIVLM